jgi:hypothetical protein
MRVVEGSLRASDGQHFVCAEPDGSFNATRTTQGPWETFRFEFPFGDERCAIYTAHGLYITAEANGELRARTTDINAWELFRVTPVNGGYYFLSAHDMYICAEGGGGGMVRANRRQAAVWEMFETGAPLLGTPVPIPGTSGLKGQVRIEGQSFVDDLGPCLPFQCHAGDLIGQGLVLGLDRAKAIIDEIVNAGYPIARSWYQLKITTGTWVPGPTKNGWDPRTDPQLVRDILLYGAQRGLKWNLSGGGIRGLDDAQEDEIFRLMRDHIFEIGTEHFFQVQASNEVRDTGDLDDQDPGELERLVKVAVKDTQILYSLTAYTGIESADIQKKYTTREMKHGVVHGSRDGHFWDKYRHIFSMMHEKTYGRKVGGQDEPFGIEPGVSAQGHGDELKRPGIMEGAAVMSLMARQWWTYMSGCGVVYKDAGFSGLAGFKETPAIIARLPRDLMTFQTLGHSHPRQSNRIHTVRPDSADVREDYAIHDDGRFVAVRYGDPAQNHDLPVHRAHDAELIVDVPGVQVRVGKLA